MIYDSSAIQAIRSQKYVATDANGHILNRIKVQDDPEYQGLVLFPNKLYRVTFDDGYDLHLGHVREDDLAAMRRNMPLMFPEDFA